MVKRFMKLGASDLLASDFEWIVFCSQTNAYYGYGLGKLYESNSTVLHYVAKFGLEKIKPVIDALWQIGWAICAEDSDEEKSAWNKFKKEFMLWNKTQRKN